MISKSICRQIAVLCFSVFVTPQAMAEVRPGIERLLELPYRSLINHSRVGILAHPASRDRSGHHIVDLLHAQPDIHLTALFAPEHGFRGDTDVQVPDSKDAATGLPIFSLYGPRQAPTPDELALIDVLVIDLQNVGMRFYTYPSTVAFALKAATEAQKTVIVLDRPEPLSGAVVEGAVLENTLIGGMTTMLPVATRHGMTLGELARFYNESYSIHADLRIVPIEGWNRSMHFEDTGLPWYPPSPALLNSEQTELYGIFGALETLALAVGRGQNNSQAFRIYGAPWITLEESRKLVDRLNHQHLPELHFEPVEWTPDRREYEGQLCRGFRVKVGKPKGARGFRSLLTVLSTLKSLFGARLDLAPAVTALGTHWLVQGLEQNVRIDRLLNRAKAESKQFRARRSAALLY